MKWEMVIDSGTIGHWRHWIMLPDNMGSDRLLIWLEDVVKNYIRHIRAIHVSFSKESNDQM